MSIFSSYKKIFLLGFIVVILIAIPFSVYIAQQRQNISSKAATSTVLSLEPASSTIKVGDPITLGIMLNPGAGTPPNQVSFVKLSISYDSTKFARISETDETLAPNTIGNALLNKVDNAQYDTGKASISLSIGADPADAIKTKTKIAILKLKAISAAAPTGSSITFGSDSNAQVLSIATTDETSENVLSLTIPATVIINAAIISVTPTPTTVPRPPSSGGGLPPSPLLIAPICSDLGVNGLASGTAPYPLTFTATGSDSDGTISKISFNFGDAVEDLTVGGGIGTSTVSGQLTHIYNTPGTYTAYAILTDNSNNLSAQQINCTKTITIAPVLDQPIQQPLPPTGDGQIMLGLGTLGVIITIIGGALLLL